MLIQFDGITEFLTGAVIHLPEPANANLLLLPDHITPASALCLARRNLTKLRRENIEKMTLLCDPERRSLWEELLAFERCILWWHYEKRG